MAVTAPSHLVTAPYRTDNKASRRGRTGINGRSSFSGGRDGILAVRDLRSEQWT
jgi:hypothetical protein